MYKNDSEILLEALWSSADRGFLAIYSLPSRKAEFFDLSEGGALEKASGFIGAANGNQNVYHTLGLLRGRPERRGEESDVIGIPALWMDIDIVGQAHKKDSLPSSLQECLDFLSGFPLKPSLIINSGYGLHVYWVFKEAWYFNEPEERKKARLLSDKFQNTLIQMAKEKGWDLDKTSDLVRLLRVPGTYNYKNPHDPKLVEIINSNNNRYNPEDFEPFLIEAPAESSKQKFDASRVIHGVSKGERNESIFKFACSKFAKGYAPKDVWELVKTASAHANPNLSEKETESIFKSALKYQKGKPFFENKKFVPDNLVSWLVEHNDLFHDGKSFFKYNGAGLWKEVHENAIGKEMKGLLGKKARRSYIQDAMKLLEFEVFKNDSELEQRFDLINLSNGMLDVQANKLLPHDKRYYSRNQIPIEYKPEADAPRFKKFLNEIFKDDPAKAQAVQEFTGYILLPKIFIHSCLFLLGSGANGKSVLINTISKLVGRENISALELHQFSKKFLLGVLRNKMLNMSTEVQTKSVVDDSIFKQVISGDLVQADVKFKEPITFRPFAKHIFSMNDIPVITDRTHAFKRRLIVVKFNQGFEGEAADKFLEDKLSEELPGILNWALKGLSRVLKNNRIFCSEQMEKDKKEFFKSLNPVLSFVEEVCELGEDFYVGRNELFKSYREWSKDSGLQPLGKNKFYRQIRQDFPEITDDTHGVNSFRGITIVNPFYEWIAPVPF
ncbi:MAG: primase C-terminal domain-containing protein [bacterium]|nr:MAG: primase C-terminal domain-containing protein [bacterium]